MGTGWHAPGAGAGSVPARHFSAACDGGPPHSVLQSLWALAYTAIFATV